MNSSCLEDVVLGLPQSTKITDSLTEIFGLKLAC
jgi:hypothetical protein